MPVPEDNISTLKRLAAADFEEVFSDISEDIQAVKDCIASQLITSIQEVDLRLSHITSVSGKMLRPALVILSGTSCGGVNKLHVEIAAIIEMVHIATLLHDDVIDQAHNRRNLPTPNHLWGNESAVLLGDFLLSKSFAMAAGLSNKHVASILAETAISICTGELTQNANKENWQLTEQQYFDIIKAKTASLFSACCRLGAIAADSDEESIQALSDYGMHIGIAFQVADDLIDIMGDKSEGKTLGRDLAERKPTLPLIHLMKILGKEQSKALIAEISAGNIPQDYLKMLTEAGSLDYCKSLANKYCQEALKSLATINAGNPKSHLTKITALIIERCG